MLWKHLWPPATMRFSFNFPALAVCDESCSSARPPISGSACPSRFLWNSLLRHLYYLVSRSWNKLTGCRIWRQARRDSVEVRLTFIITWSSLFRCDHSNVFKRYWFIIFFGLNFIINVGQFNGVLTLRTPFQLCFHWKEKLKTISTVHMG